MAFSQQNSDDGWMNEIDNISGYSIPVDPMDDLQCESCQ